MTPPRQSKLTHSNTDLDRILGRHSTLYNYSKAETKAKLESLITARVKEAYETGAAHKPIKIGNNTLLYGCDKYHPTIKANPEQEER